MKKYFLFLLKYIGYWLVLFIVSRILFLFYNHNFSQQLSLIEIIGTFTHGLKLDISMTSYILLFLLVICSITTYLPLKVRVITIKTYTLIFTLIFSFLVIIDCELYSNWGFRMDSSILLYLKTPAESFASTPVWLTCVLLFSAAVYSILLYQLFKYTVIPTLQKTPKEKWYFIPTFLILAASSIIPMRGGIGVATINQGSVYFSKNTFANHAAINVIWNLAETLSTMNNKQQINYVTNEDIEYVSDSLFRKSTGEKLQFIDGENPNIIIIVLESFTSVIIEALNGVPNVTPQLNKLANEGVLFTDFYASGERSDKGIVSLLSGYPAQPTTSILKYITKMEQLPHLSMELAKLGYSNGFYYGGEIDFANMRSYFISGKYDTIVSKANFSKKEINSKWGAHDHIMFNRFFSDVNQLKSPFCRVLFTLSSHEPFDVPHTSSFNGTDTDSKFLNSAHYTDSCLGDFIQKAKKTDWWDNTWIILVADHATRMPGNIAYNIPKRFKIPMLWIGGAVNTDTVITQTASQVDLPLMIGNQLNRKFEHFDFSKDVLSGQPAFAFYAYNNGFGYLTDSIGYVWDNTLNELLIKTQLNKKEKDLNLKDLILGHLPFTFNAYNNDFELPNPSDCAWENSQNKLIINRQSDAKSITVGKAFMQKLMNDFNSK